MSDEDANAIWFDRAPTLKFYIRTMESGISTIFTDATDEYGVLTFVFDKPGSKWKCVGGYADVILFEVFGYPSLGEAKKDAERAKSLFKIVDRSKITTEYI